MIAVIMSLMFLGVNNIVAVLPEELEIPQSKEVTIKKSKGKGKGNVPYFAKYFQ